MKVKKLKLIFTLTASILFYVLIWLLFHPAELIRIKPKKVFVQDTGLVSGEEQKLGSGKSGNSTVLGFIRDPNGTPVEGIQISCFYFRDNNGQEFEFEGPQHSKTDKDGRYTLTVVPNLKYKIETKGDIATPAVSKNFMPEPNKVYHVEDLAIQPATSSLTGIVLDKEGNPVKDFPFLAYSKNFWPFPSITPDINTYPHTGANGEFYVPHALPEELSLIVITSDNTAQIWKHLKPGSTDLKLSLNFEKFIELPPGWKQFLDLYSLSINNNYVENNVLSFNLPDLNGNLVSLADDRFKNKPILVVIWGTWCGGCIGEIPLLIDLKNKYANRNLEIIGIAFGDANLPQQVEKLKSFVMAKNINYTILYGGSPKHENVESVILGLKEFNGFPTTIFIGRDGKVKYIESCNRTETPERSAWQIRKMAEIIEKL